VTPAQKKIALAALDEARAEARSFAQEAREDARETDGWSREFRLADAADLTERARALQAAMKALRRVKAGFDGPVRMVKC
jgi:hypothetical protein